MVIKEFIKKHKFLVISLSTFVVASVSLSIILPISLSKKKKTVETKDPDPDPDVFVINDSNSSSLNIPSLGPEEKDPTLIVDIHTDLQKAYLNDNYTNATNYAQGTEELSRPLAIKVDFDGEDKPYKVYFSENKDYSNPEVYDVTKSEFKATNLKVDQSYYYNVMDGDTLVWKNSFKTSDQIVRNLYVSGVTNVRDLGAYKVNEKMLNQGLILRTGRINQNTETTPVDKITAKGKKTMLEQLKVKSEIDLRMVSNNEVGGLNEGVGALGESVHYYQCPMDYTTAMDTELNINSTKKVFSILGDASNYPTFFHCSIGTDRTGYIAFLIGAILGISEDQLYRDYLFSNFGYIGGSRSVSTISGGYVKNIKDTSGSTLKEKATNYLLGLGVKQSEIDVVQNMMIPL